MTTWTTPPPDVAQQPVPWLLTSDWSKAKDMVERHDEDLVILSFPASGMFVVTSPDLVRPNQVAHIAYYQRKGGKR